MTTIRTTDLPDHQARAEDFLGGEVRVLSRSGLHPAEALLIERLAHLPAAPGALLVAGNRTGAAAMAAAARFPGCRVACHAFDLHHAQAIARNLAANGLAPRFVCDPFVSAPPDLRPPPSALRPPTSDLLHQPLLACTSALPDGPFDAALFMATAGSATGELIADQLEDLHRVLAEGGVCVFACEGESGPALKQLKSVFGGLSAHVERPGLICASAVKRGPLAKPRDFSARFAASLPGGAPLELLSLPGVFCHRRPDAGGLALAEVAARELRPGQRVLDLGCGCGLVGILLAASQPGVRVTFADSHARALDATWRNLAALGLGGHALALSDSGVAETGFDLFVGNPPYYSDFRIAQLFIDTAHAALRPGGACLLVAKSARELQARAAARFGRCEVVARRGYGVVRATR